MATFHRYMFDNWAVHLLLLKSSEYYHNRDNIRVPQLRAFIPTKAQVTNVAYISTVQVMCCSEKNCLLCN